MKSWFLILLSLAPLTANADDAWRTGVPMLYSTPLVKAKEMTCDPAARRDVAGIDGSTLGLLCPREYSRCLLEGSCVLESESGERKTISYIRYDEKRERQLFEIVPAGTCPYGYGNGVTASGKRAETCRDPFFGIAADSAAHRLGDVIFVPKLVGLKLPTGETHDGYLIVRDTNPELNDTGFDVYALFSGFEVARSTNPFAPLELDSSDHDFEYRVVTGEEAAKVRHARGYPRLNEQTRKGMYR